MIAPCDLKLLSQNRTLLWYLDDLVVLIELFMLFGALANSNTFVLVSLNSMRLIVSLMTLITVVSGI